MKSFYYTATLILLLVTSALAQSILPFPGPYIPLEPLIPGCPVPDYNIPCKDNCFDINGNNLCQDGKFCCYNQCGYQYCADPVIEDVCAPFSSPFDDCLPECYDEIGDLCIVDGKTCCSDPFCYAYCADLIPTLVCPPPPPCFSCQGIYNTDTCTDGKICCYDSCGEYCTKPDFYKVLCPNESILEAPEPWQRQTSFCIEDCDCHYNAQICCDSPCGCELGICRNPVIQKAVCPDFCESDYQIDCSDIDYCYQFGLICCKETCGSFCVKPKWVDGPASLWEIGNPEIP